MESIVFIVKSCSDNKEQAHAVYMPSLGVMSIANTLRLHGYNVEIIDFSARNYEYTEVDEIIDNLKPLYIGFSVYTETVDSILKMCKYFKKRHKGIPLVLGGPHPTLDTEYCKRKRQVDFILIGDGEHNALELAEAIRTNQKLISYDEIQGLVYIGEDGKFIEAYPRKFITNLDLLPIINRDYVERSYKSLIPTIYSSRGCPGKCVYCAAPSMSGGRYRMRDIENVFLESLYMQEVCEGYDQIFYCDDTFTVFNKRVERFIELAENSTIKIRWRCESRVDAMFKNKHLLKGMKSAGCKRIQYGIESGNQEVLDKIRKGMVLEEAYEVIDQTVKEGILVATSFIFGHFCDTLETMEDTFNMMLRLKKQYGNQVGIAHALNTPYPGTYQYDHMEELGLTTIAKNWTELDMYGAVVYTDNFSIEDLKLMNSRMGAIYHWEDKVEKE